MKTFSILLLLCLFIEISTAQTVNTFPYVQDFNQQTPCGTNSGDPCVLNIDWQNSLNDDVDWTAYNASTPTTDTGPTEDHTDGNGGTFLYIESSTNGTGYPFKVALLESPYFDFTNVAAPRLSFWHHLYGSSMGHLFVDARIGSNGTWTTVLDSLTGNQNLWNETEIALSSFALNDSVQIRFRGETGNNFFSDMAIDDIEVFAAAPYDLIPIASTGLPSSNCQLGTYNINVDLYNNGAFAITSGDMISILFESGLQSFSEDFTLTTDWQSGDTLNFSLSTNIDLSTTGIYTPTIISYYIDDISTAFNGYPSFRDD